MEVGIVLNAGIAVHEPRSPTGCPLQSDRQSRSRWGDLGAGRSRQQRSVRAEAHRTHTV